MLLSPTVAVAEPLRSSVRRWAASTASDVFDEVPVELVFAELHGLFLIFWQSCLFMEAI
jgi:hypothetical protein